VKLRFKKLHHGYAHTWLAPASFFDNGKLIGQKVLLRISDIWVIRVRLKIYERLRDLDLFNLAVDSKLRGCDLALRNPDSLFRSRIAGSPHIPTKQYARILH
jgi:hypothetical protein